MYVFTRRGSGQSDYDRIHGVHTTVATTAVGEAGRYQFLTTLHFDATSPQQTGQGSLNSERLISERMTLLYSSSSGSLLGKIEGGITVNNQSGDKPGFQEPFHGLKFLPTRTEKDDLPFIEMLKING
jgi:hypothetical protein